MPEKKKIKTPEKPKASKKKSKTIEIGVPAFIILIVLAVGGLYMVYAISKGSIDITGGSGTADKVGVGDVVVVNFIARLENKTIVDTSYAEVARGAGIHNPSRDYRPITFTVGDQLVIIGVEDGVIGMRDREKKTVKVTPDKGFGEYQTDWLQYSPKNYPIDRLSEIPYPQFRTIVAEEPVPGQTIQDPNIPWPMLIQEVTNETVRLLYTPEIGAVFETKVGLGNVVDITSDQIWIQENPIYDSFIDTENGKAKILDYNETSVILDYNHPLAGKIIYYELQLEGLIKAQMVS